MDDDEQPDVPDDVDSGDIVVTLPVLNCWCVDDAGFIRLAVVDEEEDNNDDVVDELNGD